LCWLTLSIFKLIGVIIYYSLQAKYRLGAVRVVLAIAIFGKGFLPITLIGLLPLVALIQIVEDFS